MQNYNQNKNKSYHHHFIVGQLVFDLQSADTQQKILIQTKYPQLNKSKSINLFNIHLNHYQFVKWCSTRLLEFPSKRFGQGNSYSAKYLNHQTGLINYIRLRDDPKDTPFLLYKSLHITFSYLETLFIKGLNLNNIQLLSFFDAPNLNQIDMGQNNIVTLQSMKKWNFEKLQKLKMNGNRIKQLTNGLIRSSTKEIRYLQWDVSVSEDEQGNNNRSIRYRNIFLNKWQAKMKKYVYVLSQPQWQFDGAIYSVRIQKVEDEPNEEYEDQKQIL